MGNFFVNWVVKPIFGTIIGVIADKLGQKTRNLLDGDEERQQRKLAEAKAIADREYRWRKNYERQLTAEREKSQRLSLFIKITISIVIAYGIYNYFEFAFLESIYEGIKWLFVSIYDGIKWLVVNIYDGIKFFVTIIYTGIKSIVMVIYTGIKWLLLGIYEGIKWFFGNIYDFFVSIFS